MTINYVPIKSVLFQLSTLIDDRYYNETFALEWAAQGLQKLNIIPKLEDKVFVTNIENHKAQLPEDFHYLIQIAYRQDLLPPTTYIYAPIDAYLPNLFGKYFTNLIPVNGLPGVKWLPLRLATTSASVNKDLLACNKCNHTFTVSPTGVITTSIEEGCIMVYYKGYPTDAEGELLIPDHQDVKEALLHYVLYNYWLSKYMMKEEGAESRVQFHLSRFNQLGKKAQNLNLPDVGELENIAAIWNRLHDSTSRFDNLFTTLGNKENVNF